MALSSNFRTSALASPLTMGRSYRYLAARLPKPSFLLRLASPLRLLISTFLSTEEIVALYRTSKLLQAERGQICLSLDETSRLTPTELRTYFSDPTYFGVACVRLLIISDQNCRLPLRLRAGLRRLELGTDNTTPPLTDKSALLEGCSQLRELVFTGLPSSLIKRAPTVTSLVDKDYSYEDLDFTGYPALTKLDLFRNHQLRNLLFLQTAPTLRKLILNRLPASLSGLASLSQLESLRLNFVGKCDYAELAACTKLKKLAIFSLEKETPLAILSNCSQISKLLLEGDGIASLDWLASLTQLTRLTLDKIKAPLDGSLLLSSAATLSELRIRRCPAIEDFSFVANLTKLVSLTLLRTSHPGITFAPLFVEKQPHLTSLELASCGSMADLEWLQQLPNLDSLMLDYCSLSSTRGLAYCSKLKRLILHNSLTYKAELSELAEHVSLTHLSLVTSRQPPSLKRVVFLEYRDSFSAPYSLQLATSYRLEELVLYLNSAVSLSGLEKCPRLKRLRVESRSRLDITALSECTGLEELELCLDVLQRTSILANKPRLRLLKLVNYLSASIMEPLTNCRALEELTFPNNGFGNQDLTWLSECSALRILESSAEQLVSLAGIEFCSGLEKLSLRLLFQLEELTPLFSCTRLRCLELEDARELTSLEGIAALPQLEVFSLSSAPRIKTLLPLSQCRRLTKVELVYLDLASLQGLERLPLRKLSLFDLSSLTSLDQVNLSLVEEVWLSHLKLRGVALPGLGTRLRILEIEACHRITALGNLTRCTELERVTISKCRLLRRAGTELLLADGRRIKLMSEEYEEGSEDEEEGDEGEGEEGDEEEGDEEDSF